MGPIELLFLLGEQVAIPTRHAATLLPFALPFCFWAAWNDLARMKIPNHASDGLAIAFLIGALIALPFWDIPWRVAAFAIVLLAGFIGNMLRLFGAGDAKFAASMAPFIDPADYGFIPFLFAAVLLGAFTTHRVLGLIPAVRKAVPTWESWQRGDFPMGLALGPTLIFYLLLGIVFGP